MAIAIEVYGTKGAIALAGIYDYASLGLLIEQTTLHRRDPAEIEREENERWLEENKDAAFVLTNDDGTQEYISVEEFL